MRLLIDMNLTPRWVQSLSEAGHEAVHWSSVGKPTAPDSEICAYARRLAFVVLTSDMDFPQILAHTSEAKPSVILIRGEPMTPETRGQALVAAIDACHEDLLNGAILTLDWSGKLRARLLPLR
jgi:predicted nuclease of predicted toxin-antitoxin system